MAKAFDRFVIVTFDLGLKSFVLPIHSQRPVAAHETREFRVVDSPEAVAGGKRFQW